MSVRLEAFKHWGEDACLDVWVNEACSKTVIWMLRVEIHYMSTRPFIKNQLTKLIIYARTLILCCQVVLIDTAQETVCPDLNKDTLYQQNSSKSHD